MSASSSQTTLVSVADQPGGWSSTATLSNLLSSQWHSRNLAHTAPDSVSFAFIRDDPSDTTIIAPDGLPLYRVTTSKSLTAKKKTVVSKATGDNGPGETAVVAALYWQGILPDRMSFTQGPPFPIHKFLRAGPLSAVFGMSLSDSATFKDHFGRKYIWRGNAPGRSLELFASDSTRYIARFHRSVKPRSEIIQGNGLPVIAGTTGRCAFLEVRPRALEILDLVVTSFLFIEKNRRLYEIAY